MFSLRSCIKAQHHVPLSFSKEHLNRSIYGFGIDRGSPRSALHYEKFISELTDIIPPENDSSPVPKGAAKNCKK